MTLSVDGYRAARERAGLFDRSGRGRIRISGGDAVAFLHGVLTNDITALAPGQGCYALYLTPQGRIIADLDVLRTDEAVLLGVHADVKDTLLTRFDQSIFAEDVRLQDTTAETAQWHVCGPSAADAVARVTGLDAGRLRSLPEYGHVAAPFAGHDVRVVSVRPAGLPGFDLIVERAQHDAVREALQAAGAVDLPAETVEALRVESGVPAFHVDMDETTIPLEAGVEQRGISFTKGCYVGQEVIIRVMHRGHGRVARHLMGLTLDGVDVPAAGDPIEGDGKEVGRVTSAVFSPALARAIAIGYLHRDWQTAGTAVQIVHDGAAHPAAITTLPFVDPGESGGCIRRAMSSRSAGGNGNAPSSRRSTHRISWPSIGRAAPARRQAKKCSSIVRSS